MLFKRLSAEACVFICVFVCGCMDVLVVADKCITLLMLNNIHMSVLSVV